MKHRPSYWYRVHRSGPGHWVVSRHAMHGRGLVLCNPKTHADALAIAVGLAARSILAIDVGSAGPAQLRAYAASVRASGLMGG